MAFRAPFSCFCRTQWWTGALTAPGDKLAASTPSLCHAMGWLPALGFTSLPQWSPTTPLDVCLGPKLTCQLQEGPRIQIGQGAEDLDQGSSLSFVPVESPSLSPLQSRPFIF